MTAANPVSVKILDKGLREVLTVSLLALGLFLAARLNDTLRVWDVPVVLPPDEAEQTLNPRTAEILSFGHVPAVVDALVVKAISDPAIEPVRPGTHPPLFYELDLATQLDPHQFELYWIAGSLLSIIRWDGSGAALLLDRAHEIIATRSFPEPGFQEKYWSYAWQLELMRGYTALFELQDFAKARESFELASQLPGALPFLGSLARRLETREGRIEVAARTLASLLRRKNAPAVQQTLEARFREVQLAQFLLSVEVDFLASRENSFDRFLKTRQINSDPLGGSLSWNASGRRVITTTDLGRLGVLYSK
jgi:hypothetical protein